jgi:hypothetical protein
LGDLLRLLFLVPLGFIAAVLAAALTILAGWYGHEPGVFTDVAAIGFVMGVGVWVVLEVGAVAGIPAFIVIVLAELFGWRSVIFYLAIGGALGLLTSQLHGIVWETGNSQLLLPAAGFVGGFVYWLIAGRLAGLARMPEPASPPQPPTSPE